MNPRHTFTPSEKESFVDLYCAQAFRDEDRSTLDEVVLESVGLITSGAVANLRIEHFLTSFPILPPRGDFSRSFPTDRRNSFELNF